MTECFAGLDWASRDHAVCIIDASGAARDRFDVAHDAAGLPRVDGPLASLCGRPRRTCAIAIERPSGLVVDALLEAGFHGGPHSS